jgi:peptidoglycan/xylan/chitin deacetylase (PgdA/CDA1 family)
LELKEKYTFVPLTEAYRHITDDRVRLRNFAALTADDGWASLKNIIPWLAEQRIPVTLFLNPLYLDGVHYQSRETDKLLTEEEVEGLVKQYSPLVTIASHGWLHEDCRNMKEDEFEASVLKAEVALHNINGKIPFYAFAYGKFRNEQIVFLREHSLIPVLMDGTMNYNHPMIVHRECIDCGK